MWNFHSASKPLRNGKLNQWQCAIVEVLDRNLHGICLVCCLRALLPRPGGYDALAEQEMIVKMGKRSRLPSACAIARRKMPKRRRGKGIGTPSLVVKEEHLYGSELEEEAEDLEFLQDSLAEGRAGFLKKMKL